MFLRILCDPLGKEEHNNAAVRIASLVGGGGVCVLFSYFASTSAAIFVCRDRVF